jgi:NAD(P)-dependent dehydrogenase (short-subunit alcohol dehydrogenase family)
MTQSEPRGDAGGKTDPARRRTAIITGGASGIGRALAEELARAGVHVVLADRQLELAEQVAADIRVRGGSATVAELDVRDADRFRAVVQTTVAQGNCLDYLFNNAGIGVTGEMREYESWDWDDVIEPKWWRIVWYLERLSPWLLDRSTEHLLTQIRRSLEAPRSQH